MDLSSFEVELLVGENALEQSRPWWEGLVAEDPHRSIYGSPELHAARWAAGAVQGVPHLFVVRRQGLVVGLAPMQLRRARYRRMPYRLLEAMVPRACFVAGAQRPEMVATLVSYWTSQFQDWDILSLDELSEDAGDLTLVKSALAAARVPRWTQGPGASGESLLSTQMSWEDYKATRTRHFRKRYAALGRSYREDAELEYIVVGGSVDPDLALGEFFELEERSWKSASGNHIPQRDLQTFFALSRAESPQIRCEISYVKLGGQRVGGFLSYVHYGIRYLFVTFYDQELAKKSPGLFLMGKVVERSLEDADIQGLSFVTATVASERWTHASRDYGTVRLYGGRAVPRLMHLWDRWKQRRLVGEENEAANSSGSSSRDAEAVSKE